MNEGPDVHKEDITGFAWRRLLRVLALFAYAVLLVSMLVGNRNRDWDDALIILFIFTPTFYGSFYALNKFLNHIVILNRI